MEKKEEDFEEEEKKQQKKVLFLCIATSVGYLMPKLLSEKNSSGTI